MHQSKTLVSVSAKRVTKCGAKRSCANNRAGTVKVLEQRRCVGWGGRDTDGVRGEEVAMTSTLIS